jgi:hypothetical protein
MGIPPESDEQQQADCPKSTRASNCKTKQRYNVGLQKEIVNKEQTRRGGVSALHLASRFVVLVMWHMFVHRDKAKVGRDWLFKTGQ